MRLELRMRYLERIYKRYRKASKESKGKILDELCQVCGYNRKYAIWKLKRVVWGDEPRVRKRRQRPCRYDYRVAEVVEAVWRKANCPWSLRLKEILRLWLPWIRVRYRISKDTEAKLLSISASTIDRLLRNKKRRFKRRLYGRTSSDPVLWRQIWSLIVEAQVTESSSIRLTSPISSLAG